MKTKIILGLILSLGLWTNLQAAPKEREGTKVELTAAEVADLKVWVDNAKTNLQNLLDQIRYLSSSEKLITMQLEFNRIVNESSKKDNELYIRYVLNRALTVEEIIFDYKNNPIPTNLEQEMVLALFTKSINMALTLYVDDKAYLEAIGKGEAPKQTKHMAVFGFEYAELLINDAKTLLNPHLEYLVTRTALGFLGNDLNSSRNLDRILFHDEILHIQQLLAIYGPTSPADDQQAIQQIRRMKYTYREQVRGKVIDNLKNINLNFSVSGVDSGRNNQSQKKDQKNDYKNNLQSKKPGSKYKWMYTGQDERNYRMYNCAEVTPDDVMIDWVDKSFCRNADGSEYNWETVGNKAVCAETTHKDDKYPYNYVLGWVDTNYCKKNMKYKWMYTGQDERNYRMYNCAEVTPDDVMIDWVDKSFCRNADGSEYNWETVDNKAVCAETTHKDDKYPYNYVLGWIDISNCR